MIPRPVNTGSWSMTNGTAIPSGPGLSHASPSSVRPCTAMATSAASAACSWTAIRTRGRPGFWNAFAAIPSPIVTDAAMRTSATMPDARLASHHPNSIGSRPRHAATWIAPSYSVSTPP